MYKGLVSKPSDPVRTEYNFAGWYTTPECVQGTQWDFSTDRITEDITLYAKWIINSYSITFESNGGSSVESQICDYGSTVQEVESIYAGHSLFGWYTEDGRKWDFDYDMVEGSITLHAEWYDSALDEYLITQAPDSTGTYNGHRYQLFNFKLTWENARDYCRLLGGHLATITSAGENNIVANLGTVSDRWLGATDAEQEGTWQWITGETFSYSNWYAATSEPNGETAENYLHIRNDVSQVGTWNDNVKSKTMGFVCEFEDIDSSAPTISDVKIIEQDLTGYTVQCVVRDDSGLIKKVQFPTWTLGDGQDDLVLPWRPNPAIVGQKDQDTYTFRVNISEHNNEYGVYQTRIYAFDGQDNKNEMGSCVINVVILPEPVATKYFKNSVYELYNAKVTFSGAYETSKALGGFLSCAGSASENGMLFELAKKGTTDIWICGSDADQEGIWKWLDNNTWGFSNWASGEPNNSGDEDYVGMYLKDGTWNDSNGKSKIGFVCKYTDLEPKVRVINNNKIYEAYDLDLSDEDINAFCTGHNATRVSVDETLSPGCTFAYEISINSTPIYTETASDNGHKYLLFNDKYTWKDAKLICEYLGGHLVTITSDDENRVVVKMIMTYGEATDYWYGATDIDSEGTWKWVTGEPMTNTYWDTNEPNNAGIENYLALNSNYKWNDLGGTNIKGFVCEIE